MRERLRRIALATAAVLCACGGSGSTGLILPESSLLAEVRRDGTCIESEGVTYCATDSERAVSSDGQSALAPAEMGSPGPCPNGSDPCPGNDQLGFTVRGFPEGAACALATRSQGGGDWAIGSLVPVGPDPMQVPVAEPTDVGAGTETVLLCFDVAPPAFSLPSAVGVLAEANPDVVFVPRAP